MGHTSQDGGRLLGRVRRIQGQVSALERALEAKQDCADILQLIAACRGAMNGLMAEVVEGHIRHHVADQGRKRDLERDKAAEVLIALVRSYLK